MTLVDTNVIIDVLLGDAAWMTWSAERLEACRNSGPLYLNEIGYAELSAKMDRESDVEAAVGGLGLTFERMPTSALYAAGQAFRRYRAAGGPRLSVLPYFFVGAHAQVNGMAILTRDGRPYRTYFPDVRLITP